MLWDIVFEFFVKYIFGGAYNGSVYDAHLGVGFVGNYNEELYTVSAQVFKITNISGQEFTICLGNYLSLIATIITMVAIVLICCALIKKIYNICAHVIW